MQLRAEEADLRLQIAGGVGDMQAAQLALLDVVDRLHELQEAAKIHEELDKLKGTLL